MVNVLFVCMGNICRSPTAEGVFSKLLKDRGLTDKARADSAGTSAWHVGEPPDPRSREEARGRGIDLGGQRARGVEKEDFDRFDYIVAMDDANLEALQAQCPKERRGRLYRLTDFGSMPGITSVPDPYYGGDRGFAQVFDIVANAASGLLDALEADGFQGRKLPTKSNAK